MTVQRWKDPTYPFIPWQHTTSTVRYFFEQVTDELSGSRAELLLSGLLRQRPPVDPRAGHGHGGLTIHARPTREVEARHTPSHRTRVPPLRHRHALPIRGSSRGSCRRGLAGRPHQLSRWALHHLQALVQRRSPRPGPSRHPPEPQVKRLLLSHSL